MVQKILTLMLVLASAVAAHASKVSFTLTNDGRKSIRFADAPASAESEIDAKNSVQKFEMVESRISILSDDTVRITLTSPIQVRLEEAGQSTSVAISSFDVRLKAADLAALNKLENLKDQYVYRRQQGTEQDNVQEFLLASKSKNGIKALANGPYVEKFWKFESTFSLGYLPILEVLSPGPISKDLSILMSQVDGFDFSNQKPIIDTTNMYVKPEALFNTNHFAAFSLEQRETRELLDVTSRVTNLKKEKYASQKSCRAVLQF